MLPKKAETPPPPQPAVSAANAETQPLLSNPPDAEDDNEPIIPPETPSKAVRFMDAIANVLPTTTTVPANAVVHTKVDKGTSLERWVPIIVFFTILGNILVIGLGIKAQFDREVPGVRVSGWVYLTAAVCGVDGLLMLFNALLTTRSCRKETKRGRQWFVYPDSWYDTHMQFAAVMFGFSAFSFAWMFLFYNTYGGEDAYQWPSAYNIQQWEKPLDWKTIVLVSTWFRLFGILFCSVPVYRALAEPGMIASSTISNKME